MNRVDLISLEPMFPMEEECITYFPLERESLPGGCCVCCINTVMLRLHLFQLNNGAKRVCACSHTGAHTHTNEGQFRGISV